jgi:signal transduction histidine kinase
MPLLDLFWAMLWFFLFVMWIWVAIAVIADVFRSKDMGGFAKALWVIFVIAIPWLGLLTYLIVRGKGMADRSAQEAQAREEAARAYIQNTAGGPSTADELKKLADLRASGVLTEAEFEAQKAKLFG